MTGELTVFLVDDQADIRKSLGWLLEVSGVAHRSFASAREFLDSPSLYERGCLLLDMSMPGMSGAALQQELQARAIRLPIIFLTAHGDLDTGVRAMKAGAADFLTKPVDSERLFRAIEEAFEKFRRREVGDRSNAEFARRMAELTPREREVLELVVAGNMNKQSARLLGIVEKTVKKHRASVMSKLQVGSLAELVQLYQGACAERRNSDAMLSVSPDRSASDGRTGADFSSSIRDAQLIYGDK